MKVQHASHSSLSLYDQCPRRYKIERIDKQKAEPGRALKIGSAVHAAIAAYVKHLQAEGLQTDITWQARAIEAARAAMNKEGRKLALEGWDEVASIMETFIGSHAFDPAAIAEVEKMERIPLSGGTQFWAVIDLLEVEDGQPRVRDWKSNWNVSSQAEVEKDAQLARYAWSVSRLYGYDEVRCDLEFVRYGAVRSVIMGPEQMAKAEAGILEGIRQIEADEKFEATPGNHCQWCPWSEDCPIGASGLASISSPADAAQLASEILVLEKQLKDRKSMLSDWAATQGPVTVGGEIFGHLPSKDGGWAVKDKSAYAVALEAHNLEPWDYFNINGTKLKSIRTAKKNAHIMADIEHLLEREIKTTFTHRKAE